MRLARQRRNADPHFRGRASARKRLSFGPAEDRRGYERHGAADAGEFAIADFIRIAANPVPAHGEAIDFHGADGGYLRAAIFATPGAQATVVLVSGRSEFIEKYFETISDLQSRGFAVATLDWRGQGLSERLLPVREKGHIRDFGAFRSDLSLFTDEIVRKRLPGPYILLAHSMGGAPVLQMLADGDQRFCCAVLSSPMTRLFDNVAKRIGVRILAEGASRIGLSRYAIAGTREHSMAFEGNVLTSDLTRHARFKDLQSAAPNATIREPTYGWLRAATEAMDDLHKPDRFARLKTPTLILSAEDDHLVRSSDHNRLAGKSPLIERIVIKGALHEIMMERDEIRDRFWKAFDEFVTPKIADGNHSKSELMTQA
ncbi:MAG: alpha/beta hydrolase [Parvularculaceae bacterium]|nr:alpha/beta hydrolase [Parvularculaceae bacterium]